MKKFISFIALLCALWTGAQADIHFVLEPWQQILTQATQEKKLIFLDAYTSWCGPCKWMAKTAFVDTTVSDFFNSHFINAKIDMEQGEGIEIAQTYEIKAFPTLLFVDGSGKLVHATVGARTAPELLQLAHEVLAGKFVSIEKMQELFEAGERDRKFLRDYLLKLQELSRDVQPALRAFEGSMEGDGLLDPYSWDVFQAIYRRPYSPKACYFLAHLPEFQAKFGVEPVERKAMTFFIDRVADAASKQDRDTFMLAYRAVKQAGWERSDSLLSYLEFIWTQVAEDWDAFPKATRRYLATTTVPDQILLNSVAWACFEHSTRKSDLKQALKWVDESLALEPVYANLDTKAMLLKKLGRKQEAITVAQEAIRIGKAAGEDVQSTEDALAEMLDPAQGNP